MQDIFVVCFTRTPKWKGKINPIVNSIKIFSKNSKTKTKKNSKRRLALRETAIIPLKFDEIQPFKYDNLKI